MNNNDERDYAEESANQLLFKEPQGYEREFTPKAQLIVTHKDRTGYTSGLPDLHSARYSAKNILSFTDEEHCRRWFYKSPIATIDIKDLESGDVVRVFPSQEGNGSVA